MYTNFADANDKSMRRLCGQLSPIRTQQTSDGGYFRVMFVTDNLYEGKGFLGHYQFISPGNLFVPNNQVSWEHSLFAPH